MAPEALIASRHEQPAPTPRAPKKGRPAAPSSSLILALHHRWEAAWQEHARIDEHQIKSRGKDSAENLRCASGLRANNIETDVIQQTILMQVPETREEAVILAFHLNSVIEHPDPSEREREIMAEATNTLFDFMMGEGDADQDAHGPQFRLATDYAWHQRRYRTGLTEED
jgi:hypothetical protein